MHTAKYVEWDNYVKNYQAIYERLLNNDKLVYIVVGEGEPFVIGPHWLTSRNEHRCHSLNEKEIAKNSEYPGFRFKPEYMSDTREGMHRLSIAIDGKIYSCDYKHYLKKVKELFVAPHDDD